MPTGATYTPLIGHPTLWGITKVESIDWTGPDPYVVGGVSFPASNFGWGAFQSGYGAVSQSGTYRAELRFSNNGAQATAKIVVFVIATGLEAAAISLTAEKFRLTFTGI